MYSNATCAPAGIEERDDAEMRHRARGRGHRSVVGGAAARGVPDLVETLERLGSHVDWVQSYVTGDKISGIRIAPNEELVRERARLAGLPADCSSEIRSLIDPTTAER